MAREALTNEEADHLLDLKQQFMNSNPRMRALMRRQIRYRLFRIRDGRNEFDNGLRKMIEAQLEGRTTFDQFTFSWDVAPDDPLKVVTPFEWESHGGAFEQITELCDDGVPRPKRVCSPTAFTHQE
jgi:hypothetical protein